MKNYGLYQLFRNQAGGIQHFTPVLFDTHNSPIIRVLSLTIDSESSSEYTIKNTKLSDRSFRCVFTGIRFFVHKAANYGYMTDTEAQTEAQFETASSLAVRLNEEIGRVIIGQQEVRREVLTCLLAGGHCLLRGVPGLAKTLLIKTLADAVHLKFSRIQFTPDLMPSDILGTEVIEEEPATGKRHVRFIPGPVFANVILADEINRTPPRTQSALLEAMQEYQVTVGGVRHTLERPLFVLATENPIEQEGTHPLPEAQLDRFMFNVIIDYPDVDDERRILTDTTSAANASVTPVATGAELEAARTLVRAMPAASNVVDYALRLVRATRASDPSCPAEIKQWLRWGAGPRAGQALLLGAKATALLDGRTVPSLADVTRVALPVLRHRLLVNFRAEAEGISSDRVIGMLLDKIRP